MTKTERIKMVKAMEYICRQLNDEDLVQCWLVYGVGDGDIEYGDLSVNEDDVEFLDYYIEDDHFSELMHSFLWCMKKSCKSGGLFCDDVVSRVFTRD